MSAAPSAQTLSFVRQTHSLGAAADLNFGLVMLDAAKHGRLGPTLRFYRPDRTVAFGQRDSHLPGFPAAERACREQGFEPLIRKAGGRAAAYHRGCLVVDHVEPEADSIAGSRKRFIQFGELLAGALRMVGVDAGVGEIPGEYCPGEYSVHGTDPLQPARRIKLIGTAQRVVSGAWLFSSVIVIRDALPLRRVLTGSYAALGLDWDPDTAGAAEDLEPGLRVAAVEDAVLAAYGSYRQTEERPWAQLAHLGG